MPNLPNSKSFNIINRFSKSFSLVVDGFQFATSLFMRIRFKIPIVFNSSAISQIFTNIRLRRIIISISPVKLIGNLVTNINLRRVRLNFSMKETGKIYTTIYGGVRINFVTKAIQKIVTAINLKKIRINFDPTIAQFFTLGTYDPQTLGTLDTQTLGALDYVEV